MTTWNHRVLLTEHDLFGRPGGYPTLMSRRHLRGPCPRSGGPLANQADALRRLQMCADCPVADMVSATHETEIHDVGRGGRSWPAPPHAPRTPDPGRWPSPSAASPSARHVRTARGPG